MEFSRQEYSSGLQFLPPGDLPDLGIKMTSPILAGRFFTSVPPGSDTVLKLKKSKCASSLNKDSVNQSKPIPWWLSGKESTCQCRRLGFHPWFRKIPWSRKGQPIQYSCLGNHMDRESWWATIHSVVHYNTTEQLNNKTVRKKSEEVENLCEDMIRSCS